LDYIDTVDADAKPGELLVKYSKRPEMASVFNYASMAHNNHFFFNCVVSNNPKLLYIKQSSLTSPLHPVPHGHRYPR
jgi:hypothetical protein